MAENLDSFKSRYLQANCPAEDEIACGAVWLPVTVDLISFLLFLKLKVLEELLDTSLVDLGTQC